MFNYNSYFNYVGLLFEVIFGLKFIVVYKYILDLYWNYSIFFFSD